MHFKIPSYYHEPRSHKIIFLSQIPAVIGHLQGSMINVEVTKNAFSHPLKSVTALTNKCPNTSNHQLFKCTELDLFTVSALWASSRGFKWNYLTKKMSSCKIQTVQAASVSLSESEILVFISLLLTTDVQLQLQSRVYIHLCA